MLTNQSFSLTNHAHKCVEKKFFATYHPILVRVGDYTILDNDSNVADPYLANTSSAQFISFPKFDDIVNVFCQTSHTVAKTLHPVQLLDADTFLSANGQQFCNSYVMFE